MDLPVAASTCLDVDDVGRPVCKPMQSGSGDDTGTRLRVHWCHDLI